MENKKDKHNFRKIMATLLAASSLLPGAFITEVSAEDVTPVEDKVISERSEKLVSLVEALNLELNEKQKEKLVELLDEDEGELIARLEAIASNPEFSLDNAGLKSFAEILETEDLSQDHIEVIQLLNDLMDTEVKEEVSPLEPAEEPTEETAEEQTNEPEATEEAEEAKVSEAPKVQMFSANSTDTNENEAERMYLEVIEAPNASSAWRAALNYINAYPDHSKLSEAVNQAAKRIHSLGKTSERNNDIVRAIHYYGLIKDEDRVADALQTDTVTSYNELQADIMYNTVLDAPNATTAWHAALDYKKAYPNHPKLSEAVNDAARRIYAMGQTNQKNNNDSTAIHYYEFIKDEPLVNNSLRTDATLNYNELTRNNSEDFKMYDSVINAPNATSAWRAALDFIEQYPNHSKLSEAVNHAASRIYSMGETSQKNNNISNALHYFGLVKDEPVVAETLRTNATKNYNEAQKNSMYHEVINAPNATTAWVVAQEFKENHPNHGKVSEAINHAAQRIFNMGRANQRNNNITAAIHYYELIKDEPMLNKSLQSNVNKHYLEVLEERDKVQVEKMLNKVINAPNATNAWTAANEFKKQYPGHSKLSVAFESAGRRVYNMGVSSHKAKNFKLANTYYSLLLNEPNISNSIQSEVQTFSEQAKKGIGLTTASEYFNLVMNAPNATSAWTRVNDYNAAFPDDHRLDTAIDSASRRVLSMALTHHKNSRFSNARTYYRQLAKSNLISRAMSDKVDELLRLANNNKKMMSESQYFKAVENASSSSKAWNLAIEGVNLFPSHSRTKSALNEAANRNLKLGRDYQRNGNTSQAGIYFNRVYNEERVSKSIRTLARVFLNQLQETHQPVVYIDPGHGGSDPGTSHPNHRHIGEKILNLNTSNYLRDELESRGYIVLMSRDNDSYVGLTERAIEANDAFADIFVSVHYNSMGGSGAAHGIETFIHHTLQNEARFGQETNKNNFLTEDPRIDESLRLAESVHDSLIKNTSMYNRGVKGNNFNVLRNTAVPAVLLELGFMDNTTEFNKVRQASYQKRAAKAVADGIDYYFKSVLNKG